MQGMTEDIIKTVKTTMTEKGVTQIELSEATGMTETQTSRILTGKSTGLPVFWQKALDHLGLRLVAVPKDAKITISREL
jgi:transcriptional regulator with XRE-family HTH domain